MKMVRFVSLVLVISALLGCEQRQSGSNDEKQSGTEAVQTASTLKPFEFLIDWQAEPTYLGIYYAKQIGAFKDLGLDVTIVQSWGANEAASAVAAGKYKIGTASGGATVIADSSGASLVSTAVLYPRLPTAVFGLKRTGISAPRDLVGKTVGIYAKSITRNEFDAFMKLNGLKQGDVSIVSISGADLPYLLTGKVDAVLNYFELSPTQLALDQDTFQLLLDEYGVKGYGLNIITSKETYQQDPALIEGVTQAVIRGYREGCADQDKATSAFLAEFPEKDHKYVKASWAKVCGFVGGNIGTQTVDGWQTTIDLYGKLGLLNGPVTPADILPAQ